MLHTALLDNIRIRPAVTQPGRVPLLDRSRKPLPTLPGIVGDQLYKPARCMAVSPACMGEEEYNRRYGIRKNPFPDFLADRLGAMRKLTPMPSEGIAEPNQNNPSTM